MKHQNEIKNTTDNNSHIPPQQEDNDQFILNNSIKSSLQTSSYLPSSLLKDLNTSSEAEEESEEEQDVVNLDEELYTNSNSSWGMKPNQKRLKPPTKKTKDKFYSLDDIQRLKMFQFQSMKQNQMMYQYQLQQKQQQQQMFYANPNQNPNPNQQQHLHPNTPNQPFQLNQYPNPPMYYSHQTPQVQVQVQLQPQIFNGHYMMNQYNNLTLQQQQLLQQGNGNMPMMGDNNLDIFPNKSKKNQMGFGEKILNGPKRILSSPASWAQNPLKKKKEKKKSIDNTFQSLDELLKYSTEELYSFIITQKGSREVQKLLYKISLSDLSALVNHLSKRLSDLMIDKYANYFCQKLIQNCSPELRIQILKNIKERFIEISCNSFGTHSLQTLIEIANMPSEHEVLRQCVETGIITLALDTKGTHVLQKFLACCNENQQGDIPSTIINHFNDLINNSHGVCVLIKVIQNSFSNQELKDKFISLISENALEIIQNPFGNYVVQSLFKECDVTSCKDILKVICDNFFSLSMQKFSSNVVESIIALIDQDTLKKLFNEVITDGKLGSMIKNTYGYFVMEKMVTKLDNKDKKILYQELQALENLGKDKGAISSLYSLLFQ